MVKRLNEALNSKKTPLKGEKPAVDFEIEGTEEEKARITSIINRLAKSEIGLEAMKVAKEAGYSIGLVASGSSSCNPVKKKIFLSSQQSSDVLVFGLAHEARHAGQYFREANPNIQRDTIKTHLMLNRAMEADAHTTAAKASWQLKEQGDTRPFKAFAGTFPSVAIPFGKTVKETGDVKSNEVQTKTFLGWYDDIRTKEAYEYNHHVIRLQFANKADFSLDESRSGKEIIENICQNKDGSCYFTEKPEMIEQGKYADVAKSTVEFLDDYMSVRKEEGLDTDESYKSLPVREAKKEPEKEKSNELRDFLMEMRQKEAKEEIEKRKKPDVKTKLVKQIKNKER